MFNSVAGMKKWCYLLLANSIASQPKVDVPKNKLFLINKGRQEYLCQNNHQMKDYLEKVNRVTPQTLGPRHLAMTREVILSPD